MAEETGSSESKIVVAFEEDEFLLFDAMHKRLQTLSDLMIWMIVVGAVGFTALIATFIVFITRFNKLLEPLEPF